VGVIATEATILSQAYPKALRDCNPKIRVVGTACPLFVPLVEEGWWSHAVTRKIALEYLKPIRRAGADTLILGCTHYPLIKSVLRREAGSGVQLIDSASEVAREVDELRQTYGLSTANRKGSLEFLVSDGPDRFLRLAQKFLGLRVVSNIGVRRIE
jgi:glutamate racemase